MWGFSGVTSVELPNALLGRALMLLSGLTRVCFRLHQELPLKWWTVPEGWSGFLFFRRESLGVLEESSGPVSQNAVTTERRWLWWSLGRKRRGSKKQIIERTGNHPRGRGQGAENQIDKRDRTLSSMLHFFKNATQLLQTIRIRKSQAVGTLYFLVCYCENVYNKKF